MSIVDVVLTALVTAMLCLQALVCCHWGSRWVLLLMVPMPHRHSHSCSLWMPKGGIHRPLNMEKILASQVGYVDLREFHVFDFVISTLLSTHLSMVNRVNLIAEH